MTVVTVLTEMRVMTVVKVMTVETAVFFPPQKITFLHTEKGEKRTKNIPTKLRSPFCSQEKNLLSEKKSKYDKILKLMV